MAFTCDIEIELRGGAAEERRRAAALLLAADSIDEDSASREELPDSLLLRCRSEDGLPEEELLALAPQFPGLGLSIAYFSRDGEFCGYALGGALGPAAESEDLDAAGLDEVGRRHDGDGIAYVKERWGLRR